MLHRPSAPALGQLCLVPPNWSVQLPKHPYYGDDPDGFMARDEIVADLER